jgi:hypothetical protein
MPAAIAPQSLIPANQSTPRSFQRGKARAARAAKGDEMTLHILNRVWSVLRVDPREVHAAIASKFADDKVAHRYDASYGDATLFQVRE